jgi:beta-lactamase class A
MRRARSAAVAVAALLAAFAAPLAAVAAPRAAAAPRPPADFVPDISAARAYAATRPGTVAFAVRTEARFWGVQADRSFPSASVLKAMLLVAYTRHARDRPLTAAERRLLAPMIRWSDNAAASTLFTRVGTTGLNRLARAAHMTRFKPATPIWGNSQITARDQTRFFLQLDSLLPKRHRAYGLRLLRQIVTAQRWGIGKLALPDWRVYFKGGWGSGTGAVDHQVALLTRGDERVSVAVLTAGNGSHAAGKETLEGVLRRLLNGL